VATRLQKILMLVFSLLSLILVFSLLNVEARPGSGVLDWASSAKQLDGIVTRA